MQTLESALAELLAQPTRPSPDAPDEIKRQFILASHKAERVRKYLRDAVIQIRLIESDQNMGVGV